MKLSLLSAVTHFAAVILGGIVVLLASGCGGQIAEAPGDTVQSVAAPPSDTIYIPSPIPSVEVAVSACSSFSTPTGAAMAQCPAGYALSVHPEVTCNIRNGVVVDNAETAGAWRCSGYSSGPGDTTICLSVICERIF